MFSQSVINCQKNAENSQNISLQYSEVNSKVVEVRKNVSQMNQNTLDTDSNLTQRTERQSWFNDIMKVSLSSSAKTIAASLAENIIVLPKKKQFNSKVRINQSPKLSHSVKFFSKTQRVKLKFQNVYSQPAAWKLATIGKPYLQRDFSNHPVNDVIFKFDTNSGRIEAFDTNVIIISFHPLLPGLYIQTFQVRVYGYVITLDIEGLYSLNNPKKIAISGKESYKCSSSAGNTYPAPHFDKKREYLSRKEALSKASQNDAKNILLDQVDREALLQRLVNRHLEKESLENIPAVTAKKINHENVAAIEKPLWLTLFDRPPTPGIPDLGIFKPLMKRNSSTEHNHYKHGSEEQNPIKPILNKCSSNLIEQEFQEVLNFGDIPINMSHIRYFKLCNPSYVSACIEFRVCAPFSVPARYVNLISSKLEMAARSYILIPVRFYPKSHGKFKEVLLILQRTATLNLDLKVNLFGRSV
jgi:hypothetical protein